MIKKLDLRMMAFGAKVLICEKEKPIYGDIRFESGDKYQESLIFLYM